MATIEVDETEYLQMTQRYPELVKVATVVDQMLNKSPEARRKFLEAQKILNPNVPIPELDAAAPMQAEIDKLRKEIADDKAAREKAASDAVADSNRRAFQAKWEAGRAKLKSMAYTDEGITAIEKLMEDEGIANHEIAAAHFDRLNPPPEPIRTAGPSNFDLLKQRVGEKDPLSAMLKGEVTPDQFTDQTVANVLGEMRQGQRR